MNKKRAFDLVVGTGALAVTSPVQAAVALLVAASMGRPIFFKQTRTGLNGLSFELVKFRTMRPIDHSRGWVDDASRITRVGALLRSTSLDELPTLWHIARGDMSLVGPRPLLPQYCARYSAEQSRRLSVRPGLTGLAQISGRNRISWDERLRLDVEYVDAQNMMVDLQIIYRTVSKVLRREGISAPGEATMAEFMGTPAPEG